MNEIFLLKLGEIVLKGQNRKQFESKLRLYACAAGTIGTGNGENDWSGQHDDKMIDD